MITDPHEVFKLSSRELSLPKASFFYKGLNTVGCRVCLQNTGACLKLLSLLLGSYMAASLQFLLSSARDWLAVSPARPVNMCLHMCMTLMHGQFDITCH